jgi:hypothetical protein
VSRAQFEAAMKACGAPNLGKAGGGRLNSPQFTARITKFAACLREHGVDVPPPDTSGNGPIFNTSKVDTKSSKFRIAVRACRPLIATRPPSGTAPAPGA